MSFPVQVLTEEEVRRCIPANDEGCFGSLQTRRGHLPLCALTVHAKITGLLVETEIVQTFVNVSGEPIEATYIFPLPDRAAVTAFQLSVDGRVVEGVLKERGAARREYDQAIAQGHRAAITEEERPDVFTMRVGNLMPGERAQVRLSMAGPLPYSEGEATFRFPLVVAPRYIPGAELGGIDVGDGTGRDTDAVPDASRITPPTLLPGYPNPVQLSLMVDIDEGALPVRDLKSSLHAVLAQADGNGRIKRIHVQPGERLNRDFILRLAYADADVQTGLSLCPDADRPHEGTFALTLMPPALGTVATKPRDIVFVLDRSGSMGGWKMVAARRAVGRMIDTLRDDDRFCLLSFDHGVESPQDGQLVPATDRNRYRCVEALAKICARGGTEMHEPLRMATEALKGGYLDRERVVVLITDGQVGNESQILKLLDKNLKATRIFTLGIDRSVNAGFLQRMASMSGGDCELVESEARLDEVLAKVGRRIEAPVVGEIQLAQQGMHIDWSSVTPAVMPDLFAGSPVTILGRYTGQAATFGAHGTLDVTGVLRDGSRWHASVRPHAAEAPVVEKCWARGRVRDLEDQFEAGQRGLAPEITALSLRHGVLCKFTSFVAVDREVAVNPGGQHRKVTQAVETPDGWAMLGAGDSLEQANSVSKPSPAPFGLSKKSKGRARGASLDASRLSRSEAPASAEKSMAALPEEIELASRSMDRSATFDDADELLEAGDLFDDESGGMALPAPSAPPPAPASPAPQSAVPGAPAAMPPLAESAASMRGPVRSRRRGGGLGSALVGAGRAVASVFGGKGNQGQPPDELLKLRGAELLAFYRGLPRIDEHQLRSGLQQLEGRLSGLLDEMRAAGLVTTKLVELETMHRAVREALMRRVPTDMGELMILGRFVEDSLVAFAAGTRPPAPPPVGPVDVVGAPGTSNPGAGGRRDDFWR